MIQSSSTTAGKWFICNIHLHLRLYIYLHPLRLCCKTTHPLCFIYIYGVSAATTAALVLLKNDSFTSYQKETPARKELSICTYGSTPAGKLFISCIYLSAATPLHSSAFTSPILLLKNDSWSISLFRILLKNDSSTSSIRNDYIVSLVTALIPETDLSPPTALLPDKDASTSTPRHLPVLVY